MVYDTYILYSVAAAVLCEIVCGRSLRRIKVCI